MLCVRTTPIRNNLPSPAELIFGRKIQANLPTISLKDLGDDIKDDLHKLHTKHIAAYDSQSHWSQSQSSWPTECCWSMCLSAGSDHEEMESWNRQTNSWRSSRMLNGAVLRRNRIHICPTGERLSKTLPRTHWKNNQNQHPHNFRQNLLLWIIHQWCHLRHHRQRLNHQYSPHMVLLEQSMGEL